MKIIFTKSTPDDIRTPFVIYNYDESKAQNSLYIDVRGIVRKKGWAWLDDIQISHGEVSEAFLRFTRLWWVTGMSRLDARPWCQEHLVKPLLYAKAIGEWIRSYPDVKEVLLIGCDPMVAVYLREFDKSLVYEGMSTSSYIFFFVSQAIKQTSLAFIKMLASAYYVCRFHAFKPHPEVQFKTLVFYELVAGQQLSTGYKYFYGSIIDTASKVEANNVGYCCVGRVGHATKTADRKKLLNENSCFILLDNIKISDLLAAVLKNIYIIAVTGLVAISKINCRVQGSLSDWFWPYYLFQELGRVPCFSDICSYAAISSLLKRTPQCKLIIYPYEEKGVERSILFACQEYGIRTIGYTPHPQYRSALALRDTASPLQSKPSEYAVCGSAYVDYYTIWGKKNHNSIRVWGSEKSFRGTVHRNESFHSHLTVLLLLSHPNEMKVFYSWLRTDWRLTQDITFISRFYRAAKFGEFERVVALMMHEFDCVKESRGQLDEDLRLCDIAAFCGTSAGPQAVNMGYLGIYLDLNDCLEINPCFDDLDAMLPCRSGAEFAHRLHDIRNMSGDSLKALHQRQLVLAEKIFTPVQITNVREGIL